MLRYWGGSGEGDVSSNQRTAPHIDGLTGTMQLSNKAKRQWTKAVLTQAGQASGDDSSWDRLSRTMPPAARALLRELDSQNDGQPGTV